jgi:hypothetical protein
MLHITNGESAAIGLRRSGIPGVCLAWRDLLHDGPVPAGLSLDELSDVRARFIAGLGWAPYEEALEGFRHRDSVLQGFRNEHEVVLWFEHDLYDQLQLLQILAWLAGQDRGEVALSLVSIDSFPGLATFHGLGELAPSQLSSLFPNRQPITTPILALAQAAWDAFRSPDPTAIEHVLAHDTAALPFLASALRRHLQQFPGLGHGLSRSQRHLLEVLAAGTAGPVSLFVSAQTHEEAPFLGDWPFWQYLRELAERPAPLVVAENGSPFTLPDFSADTSRQPAFLEQELTLTEQGRAVLSGEADWMQLHGIDRWLGGVHLSGHNPPWRWDESQGQLVPMPAPAR